MLETVKSPAYSVTLEEAQALINFIAENGILGATLEHHTDTNGQDFFGFACDIFVGETQVGDALVRAAKTIRSQESGSWVTYLATAPGADYETAFGTNVSRRGYPVHAIVWDASIAG